MSGPVPSPSMNGITGLSGTRIVPCVRTMGSPCVTLMCGGLVRKPAPPAPEGFRLARAERAAGERKSARRLSARCEAREQRVETVPGREHAGIRARELEEHAALLAVDDRAQH